MRTLQIVAALVLASTAPALGAPPRLVKLVPEQGTRAADTTLTALEMHFDVPMNGGVTLNGAGFPEVTGAPAWDSTRRVLRVPVRLAAAHSYRLQLNSPSDLGFASAAGEPLPPTTWAFRTAGTAPPDDFSDPTLAARLARVPAERRLAGDRLHMTYAFAAQARIVLEARGSDDTAAVERMVREVYAPHADVWRGYVGDEDAFRENVAWPLLGESHPIRTRIAALLALDLDSMFVATERWVARTTGQHPQGRWLLLFGPGSTDMGGIGALAMVADFTKLAPDRDALTALLPHELVHQVHGRRRRDPGGDTVLGRTISEGIATYASFAHGGGARSEARSLGYTDEEWTKALALEHELAAAIGRIRDSRRPEDVNAVASRSERLLPGGPPAAGYFVGFRIAQAWVARHGRDSWPRVLRLPVAEVLRRSGYLLGEG